MSQTRSFLYALARGLGDVQAVAKGPRAVAKRVVRRSAHRHAGKATQRFLRAFGL